MNKTGTRLTLKVIPNATKNEVILFSNDVLKIRIAASPVKGKVNREIIKFISQLLSLPRSSLCILKGHKSRDKILYVDGLIPQQLLKQLTHHLGGL